MQVLFHLFCKPTAPICLGLEPSAAEIAVFERWRSLFPDSTLSAAGDDARHEEWLENACLLFAAIDAGLPVFAVSGQHQFEDTGSIVAAFNTDQALPASDVPMILMGAIGRRSVATLAETGASTVAWPDLPSADAANEYAANPAFAALAGRHFELADIPGENIPATAPTALVPATERLLARATRPLLAKIVARQKYAQLLPVAVAPGAATADINQALVEALEYTLVHLEGTPRAVLLQERVDMRYEYRVVVVDGAPVAGAGCVDRLSPADADLTSPPRGASSDKPPIYFDARLEEKRGAASLVRDTARAERYWHAATEMARALTSADPRLRDFTLDLAEDEAGNIIIIELNPLLHFGCYAMHAPWLFAHMLDAARKRACIRPQRAPGTRCPHPGSRTLGRRPSSAHTST